MLSRAFNTGSHFAKPLRRAGFSGQGRYDDAFVARHAAQRNGLTLVELLVVIGITGILVALISSILAALFSVLNKTIVDRHDPLTITFVELGSGWRARPG